MNAVQRYPLRVYVEGYAPPGMDMAQFHQSGDMENEIERADLSVRFPSDAGWPLGEVRHMRPASLGNRVQATGNFRCVEHFLMGKVVAAVPANDVH